MQYKAIIFDLDGTAMPSLQNALPSDRVVQAVAIAKDKIKLCAATGRSVRNARPVIERLELEEPCIISAGTRIIDPKTYEILWEATMEPADAQAILEVCKPYPHEVLIGGKQIGEGAPAAQITITGPVNVMYIMECSDRDAEKIMQGLKAIAGITAAAVRSWSGHGFDIHITDRQATKEHAIAELLKILRLNKEDVVGVGDAVNDIHLFKGVGYKVAMGNAVPELKDVADRVCDTVENDGLAKFIEETTK